MEDFIWSKGSKTLKSLKVSGLWPSVQSLDLTITADGPRGDCTLHCQSRVNSCLSKFNASRPNLILPLYEGWGPFPGHPADHSLASPLCPWPCMAMMRMEDPQSSQPEAGKTQCA